MLNTTGKFKGMMYHQLMIRLMDRPLGENIYELWFLVNGKPVRYSAIEFALVSGLKFSCKLGRHDQARLDASTLKRRYFANIDKVSVSKVVDQVNFMKNENIESMDRLKLVYVLIISNFMLPNRKGIIDDYWFQVCDNLDICEKFDWGKRCWDKAYGDIVERVQKHIDQNKEIRENWESPGCPWFILFWMLEAIEGMDNMIYSTRIVDSHDVYPRMLRWILGDLSPNNKKSAKFLDSVKAVISQLVPDPIEKEMSYIHRIKRFMTKSNKASDNYAGLRKFLKRVQLRDRFTEDVRNDVENEPENYNVEPDNVGNNAQSTSRMPSFDVPPPWAIQYEQRFQALENRQVVEAQLAEQRHQDILQRHQAIQNDLAEILQNQTQLANAAQLAEQRHAQIMNALQKTGREESELEVASQNYGHSVDLEVPEQVEQNRLRSFFERSPYDLRKKRRSKRATSHILP